MSTKFNTPINPPPLRYKNPDGTYTVVSWRDGWPRFDRDLGTLPSEFTQEITQPDEADKKQDASH